MNRITWFRRCTALKPSVRRSRMPARSIATEPRWTIPNTKLPDVYNPMPLLFISGALVVVTWTAFALYATNNEKLNSATIRNIFLHIKSSPKVTAFIGEDVEMVPFLLEIPRVKGELNMLQGIIDVSFDIRSRTTGEEGRIFFTALRKEQLSSFQILRWRLLRRDGATLDLINSAQDMDF